MMQLCPISALRLVPGVALDVLENLPDIFPHLAAIEYQQHGDDAASAYNYCRNRECIEYE